eukprot:m.87773 g.87773  ORF g.87773 m.87773 type:complete len:71 (+) comp15144_c0_seq2:337-549(+)
MDVEVALDSRSLDDLASPHHFGVWQQAVVILRTKPAGIPGDVYACRLGMALISQEKVRERMQLVTRKQQR